MASIVTRITSVALTLLLAFSTLLVTALPARLAAAEDPVPFPDMCKVCCDLLKKNYYDHKRFHPRILVERALRALETAEMSIDTTWLADTVVLHIGDAPRQKVNAPEPKTLEDAMDIIEQVRIRVDAADFTPTRRRDLDYALINGALLSLDPHTVLFPPEPAKEFGEEIQGEFFGIGAYLVQDEGIISIDRVMPGWPAERAGVEDGDIILRIDGERTAGLNLEQAVKRIKGPKGTTVTLTLERKGLELPVELPIVRDRVQVISTRSFRSGSIGYVRMDEFNAFSAQELYRAMNDLQEQGPLDAFVIDLRFNGGGLLDSAKLISNFFLSKKGQEIVRTVTIDGAPEIFKSSGHPVMDAPMLVMVSGGSASAAEILSGALQRNDRAVVAGTTTFGKGSVQAIKPLRDGSKLKLTIQEYQLPGGVSIQDVGITPDLRLIRHSVREDGTIDILPFTREREVDDEFAIQNTSKYQHEGTYEVGWLATFQNKDDLKKSSISAREFSPDQEATRVIELLKAAAARPGFADGAAQARKEAKQRQFLIEQLKEPVAKLVESEASALAAALAKRDPPTDWGSASDLPPGALTVAFDGPMSVEAGQTASLTFTVSNASGVDAGRLYGLIKTDKYSPLWEDEVVIGRVPPNGSTKAATTFKTPPRVYSGDEHFTLEIYASASAAGAPVASLPVTLKVHGAPRPHFSYSWKVEEPSGDGQLNPGESGTVLLTLRNDGEVPSSKVKLYVFKSDDPYVQLGEVRFTMENGIPKGGEVVSKVPITVLKEVKRATGPAPFSADSVKLQIRAEEVFADDVSGIYRSTLYNTLTIPVNQPIAGGTIMQPIVSLVDVEQLPDNRVKLHVKVTDDNPKFVAMFQDEDKVDLESASALTPAPNGEGDSSAAHVSLYEPFVNLKPGLNTLRIVVSDKDDVTEVLPIRLWGGQPAPAASSPVTVKPPEAADPGTAVP